MTNSRFQSITGFVPCMRRRCAVMDPAVSSTPHSGHRIRLRSLARYESPTPVHFSAMAFSDIPACNVPNPWSEASSSIGNHLASYGFSRQSSYCWPRRWSGIRYRGILRRWGRIRYRGIFSMRIGIDACGGGCIRFGNNRSRRIGRGYSGNCWFGCRGNNSRTIGRYNSGCWKKCRVDSSSGGCWNRRRPNSSRMIGNLENRSKFVLVLVSFYLLLFFRVHTIIEYCFTLALIPIRMYINLVLYF